MADLRSAFQSTSGVIKSPHFGAQEHCGGVGGVFTLKWFEVVGPKKDYVSLVLSGDVCRSSQIGLAIIK